MSERAWSEEDSYEDYIAELRAKIAHYEGVLAHLPPELLRRAADMFAVTGQWYKHAEDDADEETLKIMRDAPMYRPSAEYMADAAALRAAAEELTR